MSTASTRLPPMPFNPTKPYNALPLVPPRADVETRPVLKACIAARAALAEERESHVERVGCGRSLDRSAPRLGVAT